MQISLPYFNGLASKVYRTRQVREYAAARGVWADSWITC